MTDLGTWVRRWWWLIVLLVAAAGATLGVVGWAWGATAFGAAAGLIEAVGTVGTLAAAVWVARGEVAARQRDLDDRERRQAAKVACWVERVAGPTITVGGAVAGARPKWRVTVRNASDEAVYRVRVHITSPPIGWALVKPGEASHTVELPPSGPPEAGAAITFIDTAGLGWSRGDDGVLSRFPYLDGQAVVEPDSPGC